MKERILNVFKDLISALQIARLYPCWHPQFKAGVERSYKSLEDILRERQTLVLGIIEGELAFEKEIFFDLSKSAKDTILYLKERSIERIEFRNGLKIDELNKFVSFLNRAKEEFSGDPQEELALLGVTNIIVGKIKLPSDSALKNKAEESVSFLVSYDDSLRKLSSSLEGTILQGNIDPGLIRLTVNSLMENLLGHYQELLNFATIKRYDLRTFFHIVNVSVLSMYFSLKLGFSKSEVTDIGIAALLHDIGKLYISRKLLNKDADLRQDELDKIRSHSFAGTEILLKYTDKLGKLPVVVCFEHHLRFDLTGYPKLAFVQKPHLASLIVSICDVYDALSERRSYKDDYPPELIYNLMMREKGKGFHPEFLEKFFKIIGVWPIGTIVELNDSRIAVVRGQTGELFMPVVEILRPGGSREELDLSALAGRFKIGRSLNPLGEGKEYLSLV